MADFKRCLTVAKGHTNSSNDVAYALYSSQGSGTGPGGHILVGNYDTGTTSLTAVSLNTWAFLAVTYDGHALDAFLNGALVAQVIVGGPISITSDPLTIGGDWSGEMFTGLIDNVRIYNAALTPDQIQADMNLPVEAFAAGIGPAMDSAASLALISGVPSEPEVKQGFSEMSQRPLWPPRHREPLVATERAVDAMFSGDPGLEDHTLQPTRQRRHRHGGAAPRTIN